MVGIAANLYWRALQGIAYTTEITMQFMFIRWMNERFPAFGAEYDVDVVSYEDCPMVLCFICYDYYVHYPDGRCPGFRRWALPVAHIFRPFRAVQFPGLFDGRCPSFTY